MGSRRASSWRERTEEWSEEEQPARKMAMQKQVLITIPSSSRFTFSGIFHTVIRRFLGDVDVVGMAFGHAGGGNAAESRLAAESFDVIGAAVAHASAEASDHLINEIAQWPAIGDAAFDAFGNELLGFGHGALAVAVLGAVDHGPHATHSAVGFVSPSLIDDHFARRFIQ